MTDSFEKSIEQPKEEVKEIGALPVWEKIPSVEYKYDAKQDMTIEEQKNADHIIAASGMNCPVTTKE